jgi:hypothetical protein
MAIETWMPVLETKVGELAGLDGGARSSYPANANDPGLPARLGEYPIAIILPASGQIDYSQGGPNNEFHDVRIIIFTATGVVAEGHQVAVPFITRMRDKLAANLKLEGTVDHILPREAPANWYEGPGGIEYAGELYTGISFFYRVKQNVSGDFTVSA